MSHIQQEYPEVIAAEDKMNQLLSQLSKLQVQYSKQITNVLTEIPKNKYHGNVLELCHDQGVVHQLNWWETLTKKLEFSSANMVGDTETISCASKKGDCGAPSVTFQEYAGQLMQQGKSLGNAADLVEAYNLCAKESSCVGFSRKGQSGPYKLVETGASFSPEDTNPQTRAFVKNQSISIPADASSLSTKSLGVPIQIKYVRLDGIRGLTVSEHAAYIADLANHHPEAFIPGVLQNPAVTSPEKPFPLTLVEKVLEMANATRESAVIVGPTQKKQSGASLVAIVSLLPSEGWTTYVRQEQFASLAQMGPIPKGTPINSWVAGVDSVEMRKRCPITCDTECGEYYFVGADNVVRPIAKKLGTCGKKPIRIRQDMYQFISEQGFTLDTNTVIKTPDACAINLLGFKEKQEITNIITQLTSLGEQVDQRVAQLRKQGEGIERETGVKHNEYNKVATAYQKIHERMTKALKVSRTTEQMVRDFDERAISASNHYVLWLILVVVLVGVIVYVARK